MIKLDTFEPNSVITGDAMVQLGNIAEVKASDIYDAALGLNMLQNLCHGLSKLSGWWDGIDPFDLNVAGCKNALIHSEVSEALEGVRKNCNDTHLTHRKMEEVEYADAIIRILDKGGARGLDIAGALIEKLAYNQQRADHKRENRAAEGGKKI